MGGKILIVGFGPGSFEHITVRAREAIQESQVIIGYNTYVDLIRDLLIDQDIVRTGMTEEVSRAQKAVDLALEGRVVAVISSGDAGVYGMAGLVYEVLIERGWHTGDQPRVEVIPGISAIHSCAALLGAPIMHDACTISLSDHLTPWTVIEKRIEAAASADFVIALYNPKSGRRTRQIAETQRILLKYRDGKTPVGLVKSAYRDRQVVVRTTLDDMLNHDIGMLTTVIIGNTSTFYHDDLMITPRGYQRKYTLGRVEQRLRPGERLKPENEPWSLNSYAEIQNRSSREWAAEALGRLRNSDMKIIDRADVSISTQSSAHQSTILEIAVSPGVANKKFSPSQLLLLATLAGDQGELEYTPAHHLIFRTTTDDAEKIVKELREGGMRVFPVGDVIKLKACDFCDGEKFEGISFAEEIAERLAGQSVEKELRIGFNGCAMACYGAVNEDIGLVFRKGRFDLFLGGKTTGRNAGPGQRVAEGIPAEQMPDLLERIIATYQSQAFPGERFHKFFMRMGQIEGFSYQDKSQTIAVDAVCGT
ncbi:precorrin-3B C(17)-methyltransferase [Ferroacidibacillus organovorans]|uniref:Precorrin-3B C(17)-methyltransferase n=1 Tax=Ferroacidibacillus organovorans TaxID=1765683 RepID=A0A1V4ERL6_9BACL|nr:precorrin-3B C(17)-methyltransferase [Ferroacidibacillus organovorans]OPG15490.1 precorrin-3B C(17)-methyltransferase [Ferroacidibacillus organovorans]